MYIKAEESSAQRRLI